MWRKIEKINWKERVTTEKVVKRINEEYYKTDKKGHSKLYWSHLEKKLSAKIITGRKLEGKSGQ